jgi:hypothetical protein
LRHIELSIFETYTYRGTYNTYGGKSFAEKGGSGTTFVQAPHSDTGKTETSLYIDNRGYQPKSTYVTDKGTDTGKTYVGPVFGRRRKTNLQN